MKRKVILSIIALLLILEACTQTEKTVWKTEPVFKIPESVFYDVSSKRIYVSNINGRPAEKNGNGFISVLDENGKVINLKWVDGLNAPKGIAKQNNKLFVTDIDRIAEIDIDKSRIVMYYSVPGASFLNDIVATDNGNIYISDSDKGVVFMLDKKGNVSLRFKGEMLKGANGLAMENGKLLVGTYNGIVEIDTHTKKTSLLVKHKGMIDGLIPLGEGKYVISDWKGKVEILQKNKNPETLINTTDKNINAADLGFIPGKEIILIPTFFDNRVIAIKIQNL